MPTKSIWNLLAEVEQRHPSSTPDSEDEHHLIAQYCQSLNGDSSAPHTLKSPMQIMVSMDGEQRTELETMIKDLEEENKNLQEEYDRLKQQSEDASPGAIDGDEDHRDSEMIAEAKLLRQHKGRLEARMQILEDHNRQLEAQLQRLRQLLDQSDGDTRILSMSSSQATTPGVSAASSSSSIPWGQKYPSSSGSASQLNGHAEHRAIQLQAQLLHTQETSHTTTTTTITTQQTHSLQATESTTGTKEGSFREGENGSRRSHDQELEEVMREINESFPPEGSKGANNVGNLFHMAGQVGKAVGTLVTVMTDDEGSGTDDEKQ